MRPASVLDLGDEFRLDRDQVLAACLKASSDWEGLRGGFVIPPVDQPYLKRQLTHMEYWRFTSAGGENISAALTC